MTPGILINRSAERNVKEYEVYQVIFTNKSNLITAHSNSFGEAHSLLGKLLKYQTLMHLILVYVPYF